MRISNRITPPYENLHHVQDVVRDEVDPLPVRADRVPQPRLYVSVCVMYVYV